MLSVIVPVYNEENAVGETLKAINKALTGFMDFEIIVVNDGSKDSSLERLKAPDLPPFKLVNHTENLGYGKSLYDGILQADNECVAIIDADGSYNPNQIRDLFKFYPEYDMVVGARQGTEYKRGLLKRGARAVFNYLSEYASGRKIPDINSGLRIFKKSIVMKYSDSLCPGFSFTTTITLIFLMNQYFVKYIPIEYHKRTGKSKVSYLRDTLRAGQIIVESILFYNPIKLFLLLANINAIFGLTLGILDWLIFKSLFLSVAAGVCIASYFPIFCFGLLADILRKTYQTSKMNNSSK